MKEIKMPYSEYEEMVQKIKLQQEVIDAFENDSKVVLIDNRTREFHAYLRGFGYNVPRITTTDPELAEKYLKNEFNKASRHIGELEEKLNSANKELYRYEINEKESGWKAFLNFYPNKK